MATLGDLLGSARRDAAAFAGWIDDIDPGLSEDLAGAAERCALDPVGFVRLALSDFSRLASEEDWATLMSGIRDSTDPGMTCLAAMVQWRINVADCAGDAPTGQGGSQ